MEPLEIYTAPLLADSWPPASAGGGKSTPQSAQRSQVRHQLRCQGIVLCFPAWCIPKEAEPCGGCSSFDRSASLSSGASYRCHGPRRPSPIEATHRLTMQACCRVDICGESVILLEKRNSLVEDGSTRPEAALQVVRKPRLVT